MLYIVTRESALCIRREVCLSLLFSECLFCYHIDKSVSTSCFFFFFQAEDGIRDLTVTGVQTCALPISATARQVAAKACHCPSRPTRLAWNEGTVSSSAGGVRRSARASDSIRCASSTTAVAGCAPISCASRARYVANRPSAAPQSPSR